MFTSSFYAVLILAAVNANAAVTGLRSGSATLSACAVAATGSVLDSDVQDCLITLPKDPLSAAGLSTPFILQPPCSMAIDTQQAFAEAAVYDPATGNISIYHPLVLNSGVQPAAPNVVPKLPSGAIVGLWFGFNGNTLKLLDTDGKDANNSPILKGANCINGLPGVEGDIFGQVSWCNAEQWFTAVNSGVSAGKVLIPPLGNDKNGDICPTSRSFKLVDQDPSDNVPTQYLLVGSATAQDTDANRKALGSGDIINNASDEALLANILDPIIGCTPFLAPSLDNPGAMVPALALSELQASLQSSPVAFVPLNDPDCLTTANGKISVDKTNTYRLGVGQPTVGKGDTAGDLVTYCNNLVTVAPSFLQGFEQDFLGQTSPDTSVGNNLFTFLAARYLSSLSLLTCPPPPFQPIVCQMDAQNVSTSCDISLASNSTGTTSTTSSVVSTATGVFNNSTVIQNNENGQTNTTAVGATTTSSTVLAATTSASVVIKVVEVEIVSFFVFVINFGGALPPPVLPNRSAEGKFIVLEEAFVELAPACQRACNHQFDRCTSSAASRHATFAVSDCKNQENNCLGVASTQTSTPAAPSTVKATATIVAAVNTNATTTSTSTAATGATEATNGGQSSLIQEVAVSSQNGCIAVSSVTITNTVSSATITGTLTVTASSYTTSPTLAPRHLHRHIRQRRSMGRFE